MRKEGRILVLKGALRLACRNCELSFYSLSVPRAASFVRRRGQTTVEYLLMLAVVAGMAAMMGALFHKKILGGIFTLVGMIIGAGTPTP